MDEKQDESARRLCQRIQQLTVTAAERLRQKMPKLGTSWESDRPDYLLGLARSHLSVAAVQDIIKSQVPVTIHIRMYYRYLFVLMGS